jgi:hypothetical protein
VAVIVYHRKASHLVVFHGGDTAFEIVVHVTLHRILTQETSNQDCLGFNAGRDHRATQVTVGNNSHELA